jgi:hypothetical protein
VIDVQSKNVIITSNEREIWDFDANQGERERGRSRDEAASERTKKVVELRSDDN